MVVVLLQCTTCSVERKLFQALSYLAKRQSSCLNNVGGNEAFTADVPRRNNGVDVGAAAADAGGGAVLRRLPQDQRRGVRRLRDARADGDPGLRVRGRGGRARRLDQVVQGQRGVLPHRAQHARPRGGQGGRLPQEGRQRRPEKERGEFFQLFNLLSLDSIQFLPPFRRPPHDNHRKIEEA